ncbi:MAG: RnfABCDGE type electron transport complex subunit G [Flavobacteriaceae bacterium]|nr:MAG: RnfABCDGE type electron transport complex subunit G [Flavobacteriaceae bacterium]
MKKKESTFINMIAALFIVTLISGFALSYVNIATEGPIAEAKLKRKVAAIEMVVPAFDNNPVSEMKTFFKEGFKDSVEVYTARKADKIVGVAVIGMTNKGFSGLIKVMAGFKPDGTINNIQVLEQKETPGLGTKIKSERFIQQYVNKNPASFNLKAKKDGGDIDALTGATISTRAFSEAVQQAYEVFENLKKD